MSVHLALVLACITPQESSPLPACAEGWKLEIVAQTPRVRHPSVVCTAPDGRVFVGEDPIDMEGPLDQPVDRIICLHPDGRRTVFAEGLGPVFGMMYLEGRLWVQHVPRFSVFRDREGIGTDRVDLIACTNPTPSAGNGLNDHIPANFHLAMDGFIYISVGQKGIHGAVGADGRRFDMREGGILRMRPDATGLEIYARGVRNILDVAITSEGELFAYDNDDHTRAWKVKLLHMVDGGYYGFPWDFKPERPYTLGGIQEFPGGAPTGILAYTEDALPSEYRDNLILCDWGRRTVHRVRLGRDGATFRVLSIDDLIPPGPNDFRPVGITVTPSGDGFYIADWNFPGWKQKKEAGRLLKLTWTGPSQAAPKPEWFRAAAMGQPIDRPVDELILGLDHPALSVRHVAQRRLVERGENARDALVRLANDRGAASRARAHALWALDALDRKGPPCPALLEALADPDPGVRSQAVRILGTRGAGDSSGSLLPLLRDPRPEIRFQAAVALGRVGASGLVPKLLGTLEDGDARVRYAAFTALHRIGERDPAAWEAVGLGLWSDQERVREGTLFALRETYAPEVVATLASFIGDGQVSPEVRTDSILVLSLIERKPPPWDGRWWRNGPWAFAEDNPKIGPRIEKILEWVGTRKVRETLASAAQDPSPILRAAAQEGLRRAEEAAQGPSLLKILGPPSPAPAPQPDGRVTPTISPEAYATFAIENRGEALRGMRIFHESASAGCIRCHRVNGQGGELGPDLSSVGSKYDRRFLIDSILYPSKQIAEGYAQTLLRTRDGQVYAGLIRAETTDEVAIVDREAKLHVLRNSDIEARKVSDLSLMPENLQASLSLQDFSDLIAYLGSLQEGDGFVPLLNGKDLGGWKKDPENEGHWTVKAGGTLLYDGKGRDLWTEKSYEDFVLKAEWRFPSAKDGGRDAVEKEAPVILPDGSVSNRTQKVLDGGDSGIFLRGSQKSQVNIWCWPIGSGEVYGYRTDKSLSPEVRAAATPKLRADHPSGEWNQFAITLKGDRLTVLLNGKTVIDQAQLPGVPARGPIGLQHPGKPLTPDMPVEFANLLIKELPR